MDRQDFSRWPRTEPFTVFILERTHFCGYCFEYRWLTMPVLLPSHHNFFLFLSILGLTTLLVKYSGIRSKPGVRLGMAFLGRVVGLPPLTGTFT
jgi:hypothetical protein